MLLLPLLVLCIDWTWAQRWRKNFLDFFFNIFFSVGFVILLNSKILFDEMFRNCTYESVL